MVACRGVLASLLLDTDLQQCAQNPRSSQETGLADGETHDLETLRLANAEMQARLDRLSSSSSKIDTKATTLVGFAIALGAFVLTREVMGWWRILPLVLLAVTCFFAWQALGVREYREAPEPPGLLEHVVRPNLGERAALAFILRAKERVFTDNKSLHSGKAKAWNCCLIVLACAAVATIGLMLWKESQDVQSGPGRGTPAVSTCTVG